MDTSGLKQGTYILRIGGSADDLTLRFHEEDKEYYYSTKINFVKLIQLLIFNKVVRLHIEGLVLYALRHFESLRCTGSSDVLFAEKCLEEKGIFKRGKNGN